MKSLPRHTALLSVIFVILLAACVAQGHAVTQGFHPLKIAKSMVMAAAAAENSLDFEFSPGEAFTPRADWPEEPFNLGQWAGYAFFLLIMSTIPIVIGLILFCGCCFFCCFRCCGLCGGKPSKNVRELGGYTRKQRLTVLIPYVLVYGIVVVATIVGICMTVAFSISVTVIVANAHKLANDGEARILDVIDVFTNTTAIADKVQNRAEILIGELNTIGPLLEEFRKHTNSFLGSMSDIGSEFEDAKRHTDVIISSLNDLSNTPKIGDDVPSGDSVPNPAKNNEDAFSTLNDFLLQMETQINSTIDITNSAIDQGFDTVKTSISEFTNELDSMSDAGRKIADEAVAEAQKYVGEDVRTKVRDGVIAVEWVRGLLIVVLFTWSFTILSIGLLAMYKGWRHCLNFLSCLVLFTAALYLFTSAFQLFFFISVTGACKNTEPYMLRVDESLNEKFGFRKMIAEHLQDVPISLDSINTSPANITLGLMNCQGNTSLIDILNFHPMEVFNITGITSEVTKNIDKSLDAFDLNVVLGDTHERVVNFTSSLDTFNLGADFTELLSSLRNITDSVDNEIETALCELNGITEKLIPPEYWAATNISDLDTNEPPYSNLPPEEIEVIDGLRSLVMESYSINEAVKGNMTQIDDAITGINSSLESIKNSTQFMAADLKVSMDQLSDDVKDAAESFKSQIAGIAEFVVDSILEIFQVYELTECSSLGDFFRGTTQQVCGWMPVEWVFLSLCNVAIGLASFAMIPIILEGSKRSRHSMKKLKYVDHDMADVRVPDMDEVGPQFEMQQQTMGDSDTTWVHAEEHAPYEPTHFDPGAYDVDQPDERSYHE